MGIRVRKFSAKKNTKKGNKKTMRITKKKKNK